MNYTYIDGDNIGLRIEKSFLENNENELGGINERILFLIENISNHLLINGQEIIFSGADGIICKGQKIDIHSVRSYIQKIEKEITFSIGSGKSLKDSYIALRYAKAKGKNIAILLDKGIFKTVEK
ncbi:MAG: mCpol domain-containing protein [Aureispira sp.]